MKHIDCAAIVPGCDFHTEAKTEEDLIHRVVVHARTAHGVEHMTPALLEKVRAAIREGRPD